MAFGRPPISSFSLEGQYEAINMNIGLDGCCNAGILVVKRRRDGKEFVQKRSQCSAVFDA